MNRTAKSKLLIVTGAGASIDFGMPTVSDLSGILSKETRERYPLLADNSTNLYSYLEATIDTFWKAYIPSALRKSPNFEDVLYSVFVLAGAFPAGRFTSAPSAFTRVTPLPPVGLENNNREVNEFLLSEFGGFLVDTILKYFRDKCRTLDAYAKEELKILKLFFNSLREQFEVAIVTLNYDDIIYRCVPDLEMGFDGNGRFTEERIFSRPEWPCLLHLHGSVHFDMRDDANGGFNYVHWVADLNGQFNQNADGTGPRRTAEGPVYPTSVLVAGLGKTAQLLTRPFRTYFAELDRLVTQCDAVLFLGYGFSDIHLNYAFQGFRGDHRRRAVVDIDFGQDNDPTARGREYNGHQTVTSLLGLFRTHKNYMTWLGYSIPGTVFELKKAKEFEISSCPEYPLAIWYDGLLSACTNIDKVVAKLRGA
jgi:SIR2-like domain